jgi:dienelactone hydrolase
VTIETRAIEHRLAGQRYEGMLTFGPGAAPRPAVIVYPSFVGRTDREIDIARRLAGLGYVGYAADPYGEARIGRTTEECMGLMQPLLDDRAGLRARLLASLDAVRAQPEVDARRIAVIGFCFGGLCALDLARSGADISGAASFHGLFTPLPEELRGPIFAKVIAFHGWDDPMCPPDTALALASELSAAGADWQLHAYGGTMHAFTNESANDPERGTVHNETAARRAWASLEDFLAEAFQ